MAFEQGTGKVVWSKHDFGNVYSSPLLITVQGLDQLVSLMDGAIIGVNPHNGDLQWQAPFKAEYSIAVATPVWGPENLLFGDRAVELESAPVASRQRHAHR